MNSVFQTFYESPGSTLCHPYLNTSHFKTINFRYRQVQMARLQWQQILHHQALPCNYVAALFGDNDVFSNMFSDHHLL